MQFKYPELLWALSALLIPIIVHLFQLRRFKKTPFTNVKMLQKVAVESQKSKSIKKWLLLFTRLSLFTALILAFAQPFFANKSALQEKETVIYLDNSFSMQAKIGNTSLLENAIQELLKSVPSTEKISVFTNDQNFKNTTIKAIQNDLLDITFSEKQLDLNEIQLKAQTLFSDAVHTIKNLVIISDFQKINSVSSFIENTAIQRQLIKKTPDNFSNVSIDSLYMLKENEDSIEINVLLSTSEAVESTAISVYNNEQLIAKTSAVFDERKKARVSFSIPTNTSIDGRILLKDNGLDYDNQFYFTTNIKDKINILVIGDPETTYLQRIYTPEEFNFQSTSLQNLNYSSIENQNLIILNSLDQIPISLQQALQSFSQNQGSLVIIPSELSNKTSYNQLLRSYQTSFEQWVNRKQEITNINFKHPLFSNVFERTVSNFQYPSANGYWQINTNLTPILSYANNSSFLAGRKGFYVFSSSLDLENSTFRNSPLIVPTLYKMGFESLAQESLYSTIGNGLNLVIPVQLQKDAILKITKTDFEFIPQQQLLTNKVALTFVDNPKEDGNYKVISGDKTLKTISFNYPRTESNLEYADFEQLNASSKQSSIADLFEDLEKDDRIKELWKWFVILALLFALIEIGIQKFMK